MTIDSDLQFVSKDCSENITLQKNDIAICMANGSKNLVGKTGVYHGDYSGKLTVGAFCSILRPKNNFVSYVLQIQQYKNYLKIILAGTSINNLKNSDLEDLNFILPSSEKEQTEIVSFISAIDEKIYNVKSQLEATKQYKQGLLQQMFV